MTVRVLSLPLRQEHDVVSARQRARHIAEALGLDGIDQTRIATAISEIARNAVVYGGGGQVEFLIEGQAPPQVLLMRVSDKGPGIPHLSSVLGGHYHSPTGLGIGLAGAQRLVDHSTIESSPAGTTVTLTKLLPADSRFWGGLEVAVLADTLAARRTTNPLDEVQQQNRELLAALKALRSRQEELEALNRELEDTNRGVVALYAELDERADHLRRADELKTKFLSNMTHEFRTPVNSILALTRLLAERLQFDDTERNEVFYIGKSAQQLSDLIDDLLDIAKVEAGKIEVHPNHFEIAGLFGALRGMLRPLLASKAVQLIFDDPSDPPLIYSDETKVSQILRNFISNALKYTEEGEVRVTAAVNGDALEIAVLDTGIGIPAGDLPRIFDEFAQIENPLQRRVKGTGLGLPLSRRLADLLGGRIHVESTLGRGSRFTLHLPLVYRDTRLREIVDTSVPAGRLAVLVVEDSDEDVLAYQMMLAGSEYHIVHARSADAALQAASRLQLAAIILDLRLHGQESWDLLIRLRRDSATSSVPVIVASSIQDQRKSYGLGADAVTSKPVDGPWLLRTLAALTSQEPPLRVLIVEDDETFGFVLRGLLAEPSFHVSHVESGEAALASLDEFAPDIMLLDYKLPGMSGDQVLNKVRDGAHSKLPVLVVTSEPLAGMDHKQFEKATAILRKSALSGELLRRAIRDAVGTATRIHTSET